MDFTTLPKTAAHKRGGVLYLLADSPQAAERTMTVVGEQVAYGSLAEADLAWNQHPIPCRYSIWEMRQVCGDWRAFKPSRGTMPRVNGLGAMGVI